MDIRKSKQNLSRKVLNSKATNEISKAKKFNLSVDFSGNLVFSGKPS
jgi:hypothetical protein